MARARETLSTLFAPPSEVHFGIAGVLCGYSAEAEFLERALTQFTGVSAASRLARGSVDLTLMVDPTQAMIQVGSLPGLLSLYPHSPAPAATRSKHMHAKVALLSFGTARAGRPSLFRTIVSTGNWTHESSVKRIEMAWKLDVDVEQASAADRRELWCVATFLTKLLEGYAHGAPLTTGAEKTLSRALDAGREPGRGTKTRFICTLPAREGEPHEALWPQMRIRLSQASERRNLLVCGSGSFEQADPNHQGEPEVLRSIAADLGADATITASAEKVVIANPDGSGQVRQSFVRGEMGEWSLCKPHEVHPVSRAREALHAKFLFVARRHSGSIFDAQMYLGSGNLSHTGLRLAPPMGNIEAGVVLDLPEIERESTVKAVLPWGPKFRKEELVAEEEVPLEPSPILILPPPPVIAFLVESDGRVRIVWASEQPAGVGIRILLDSGGTELTPGQEFLGIPVALLGRYIRLSVDGVEYKVPCLAASGEFLRQEELAPSFEGWLDQLRAFPGAWNDPRGDDGSDDDDADEPPGDPTGIGSSPREDVARDFPARTAMLLVEAIAERGEDVSEGQAPDWVAHLRLLFSQVPANVVDGWRSLRINFLSMLLSSDGFAPEWKDLTEYRALLEETARRWQLLDFPVMEVPT